MGPSDAPPAPRGVSSHPFSAGWTGDAAHPLFVVVAYGTSGTTNTVVDPESGARFTVHDRADTYIGNVRRLGDAEYVTCAYDGRSIVVRDRNGGVLRTLFGEEAR